MKKVGILTYHRAKNYGAMVQSYSLVSYLSKKYPAVKFETVDYQAYAEYKYYLKSVVRNAVKCGPGAALDELTRNRYMRKFAKTLPLSKFHVVSDDISKLFRRINGKYDLIVVGSDAIFNWKTRVFPTAFFLGEELGCKKASYAASAHGMRYLNESSDKIEYCQKALADFDYIGVRDAHTERFVSHCSNSLQIHHNCDPSLLLDMKEIDYEAVRKKLIRAGVDLDKPLILVMSADARIAQPIIEKYTGGCQFVSLYLRNPLIKKHITNLTPLEWAGIFKFAKITITEYFHGTLLSLKNLTPTVAVDRTEIKEGSEGKIYDVVHNRMALTDMYYNYSAIKDGSYAERVLEFCERAMNEDMSARIAAAVEKEAKNVESFTAYLDSILNKED